MKVSVPNLSLHNLLTSFDIDSFLSLGRARWACNGALDPPLPKRYEAQQGEVISHRTVFHLNINTNVSVV